MSRWIAILAGIVLLIAAAVIAVPMLIPTEVYKERIVSLVKTQTGRDLIIGGDAGLSFFPRLAVRVEDVRLSNADWAKDPDMASMKELRAALRIMPLFRGEVEIDSFVLVDPVIHLEVKADGTPNWQFETAGAPQQASPKAAPEETGGGAGATLREIRLGEVSIRNGSATYRNAQTGAALALDRIDLDLSMPGLDQPFRADGSLIWNGEALKLTLDAARPRALTEGGETPVEFTLKSARADASYKGVLQPLGGLRFSGDMNLSVPSVRDLAAWLGSPLAPGNGFGPLAIRGKASGSGNTYNFSDAKIGLDGMNATGILTVSTGGKRPLVKGKLALDRIDTNIYLGEKGGANAGGSTGGKSAGEEGWNNEPIDLGGLKAVDADFALSAHEILVRRIRIGESALALRLDNGVLNADLSRIELYKGAGSGTLTLDGSGRVPEAAASFSIAGVAAEPLLTDAADFTRLQGLSAISLSVNTIGRSQREMAGALGGKGEVRFTNGAIKGVNIAELVRTVLQGAVTGWQNGGGKDTDFSELGGTFTIDRGILTNKDLKLLSPLVRVAGAGTVDLPNRSLDYRVEPKLAATLEGQGGKADARGLEVPLIIEGPWSAPRFRPDLKSMIANPEQTIEQIKGLKGEGGKALLKGLTGQPEGGGGTPATAPATEGESQKPAEPKDMLKNLFGR